MVASENWKWRALQCVVSFYYVLIHSILIAWHNWFKVSVRVNVTVRDVVSCWIELGIRLVRIRSRGIVVGYS